MSKITSTVLFKEGQTILPIFKVRIKRTSENEGKLVPSAYWQKCETDGGNVVWNNTKIRPLIRPGQEVSVSVLWKKNRFSSGNNTFSEPTFYTTKPKKS